MRMSIASILRGNGATNIHGANVLFNKTDEDVTMIGTPSFTL